MRPSGGRTIAWYLEHRHHVLTTHIRATGPAVLEAEPSRLDITQKNGNPKPRQTQGKVEGFQQTLKNWLHAQPQQPATLRELQTLLDAFAATYGSRAAAPLASASGHPRYPRPDTRPRPALPRHQRCHR